ncbi:MAG TPA: hypothetical protein VFA27_04700 [Vicinamibacterales bacterium]|nr:hypothetical protein [Vicinamibacterales bacterium]
MSTRARWAAAILALFAFRLFFGLASPLFGEDETQIFLIGLRYYATGAWPYFGPDVVWTKSEIPGALQGLLVGVPLHVWHAPEAPYLLLNVLSMLGLAALCWYITERLPGVPRWLVWAWYPTLPWTLQFSTHILNPSYILMPSIAFFIAFFEVVPTLRLGKLPQPLAFAMMAAAIGWIAQVHMSYPLLVPYVAVALLVASRTPRAIAWNVVGLAAGALVTGAFIAPTWLHYGLFRGFGGTQANIRFHVVSPLVAVEVLARFFSFASLEMNRFVATDDAKRLMFFERRLWLVPFALVVLAAGLAQPVWMVREWLRRRTPFREWRTLQLLVAATVLWVYGCYWFVMEPSQSHAFYAVAPIAFIFAAYCWTFVDSPRSRRAAAALVAINIVYQIALVVGHADRSLYHDRAVVAAAIDAKQPEMFAHRRPFSFDGGPATLQDPSRPYNPLRDCVLSNVRCTIGRDRIIVWSFTLTNTNPRVAFRDVVYQTSYGAGDVRHEFLRQVWQPGEAEAIEVNDGFAVGATCDGATLRVIGAEALVPIR